MANTFTDPSGDSLLIVPVISTSRVSGKLRGPVARDGGDRTGGLNTPLDTKPLSESGALLAVL